MVITDGEDYIGITDVKMFDPSSIPRLCYLTVILTDDILEDTEFLNATLTSPVQDSALVIPEPTSAVSILDTSCECWSYTYRAMRCY